MLSALPWVSWVYFGMNERLFGVGCWYPFSRPSYFPDECVRCFLADQVITMTKSLGSLLSRAEGRLAPLLRLHVHASTQQMAQGDLVPVLHRADKKKRGIVTHLLQVQCFIAHGTLHANAKQ